MQDQPASLAVMAVPTCCIALERSSLLRKIPPYVLLLNQSKTVMGEKPWTEGSGAGNSILGLFCAGSYFLCSQIGELPGIAQPAPSFHLPRTLITPNSVQSTPSLSSSPGADLWQQLLHVLLSEWPLLASASQGLEESKLNSKGQCWDRCPGYRVPQGLWVWAVGERGREGG